MMLLTKENRILLTILSVEILGNGSRLSLTAVSTEDNLFLVVKLESQSFALCYQTVVCLTVCPVCL